MNPPEAQSDSDPTQTYFDPEGPDASEQFFSASLEHAGDSSTFVIDSSEDRPSTESVSSDEGLGVRATQPSGALSQVNDAAPELEISDAERQTESDWRDVVSAKVKHYKTVKPRKERYPSLQLQFDSRPAWKSEKTVRAVVETELFSAPADPAQPVHQNPPRAAIPVTTEATARVLEFPRPGMLPFNREELAEPVVDRPRIIEAPELLPPPPALGGILIQESAEPESERQPGLDMPLNTARLTRRAFASAVDGALVAAALAIFGYIFFRFNTELPPVRMTAAIAAALLGILWFAYQSAFLIFCATTPGLRAARLRMKRFDGSGVPRHLRRWRVVASVLSCISLGLGYAWCFFDEDELCWHDRITQTHLGPK
jgi:uncharacterized RDD family membrane protein YckC